MDSLTHFLSRNVYFYTGIHYSNIFWKLQPSICLGSHPPPLKSNQSNFIYLFIFVIFNKIFKKNNKLPTLISTFEYLSDPTPKWKFLLTWLAFQEN